MGFETLEPRVLLTIGGVDAPQFDSPPPPEIVAQLTSHFERVLTVQQLELAQVETGTITLSMPCQEIDPPFGPDPAPPHEPEWSIEDILTSDPAQGQQALPLLLPALSASEIAVIRAPGESGHATVNLPDRDYAVLAGTLGTNEKSEFLTVPPHLGSPLVHVGLKVPRSAVAVAGAAEARLIVLDELGDFIGQVAMPRPGARLDLFLRAHLRPDGTAPGLILGITRAPIESPNAVPLSPVSYVIEIDHAGPISSGQTVGRSSAANSPDVGGVTPIGWAASPRTEDVAGLTTADSPQDHVATLGPGQDGLAGLPLRSSAPSAPPVGPLDGSIIDLALLDISPDLGPTDAIAPVEALAVVASPGGFPLLGASRPFQPPDERDPTVASPEVAAEPRKVPAVISKKAARRPPVMLGLGLITAVAIGLALPELVARFAPDAPKRPLPWDGRRRGRKRLPLGPGGWFGA